MTKSSLQKAGRENWVSDDSVTHCASCSAEFCLLTRRHHCRRCGDIFCARCSSNEISYTPATRQTEKGYMEKEKRVCDGCFGTLARARGEHFELGASAEVDHLASVLRDMVVARREQRAQRHFYSTAEISDDWDAGCLEHVEAPRSLLGSMAHAFPEIRSMSLSHAEGSPDHSFNFHGKF